MKEAGIIMSGNHPKLILDGTKTMTRRTRGLKEINKCPGEWLLEWFNPRTGIASFVKGDVKTKIMEITDLKVKCPYGQVGDRLWVRETAWYGPQEKRVEFIPNRNKSAQENATFYGAKKKPSIFMPRWASRITLEITKVRVERLQEITPLDCLKEGVNIDTDMFPTINAEDKYRSRFQILWDSLNAERGYSWEVNPWVWVISFRRVKEVMPSNNK